MVFYSEVAGIEEKVGRKGVKRLEIVFVEK